MRLRAEAEWDCLRCSCELFEPEFPLLESLVSLLTPAPELFRYDQAAAVIYICCFKLPAVRRTLLLQELAAKNVETKLHGDHYIICPAAWLLKVLEQLYGQPFPVYAGLADRTH